MVAIGTMLKSFTKLKVTQRGLKHERDCHLTVNDRDGMELNGTITEINEIEICQKILLNTIHQGQMRTGLYQSLTVQF